MLNHETYGVDLPALPYELAAAAPNDVAKVGASAFFFVNLSRLILPLRLGLALSTVGFFEVGVERSDGQSANPSLVLSCLEEKGRERRSSPLPRGSGRRRDPARSFVQTTTTTPPLPAHDCDSATSSSRSPRRRVAEQQVATRSGRAHGAPHAPQRRAMIHDGSFRCWPRRNWPARARPPPVCHMSEFGVT